MSYNLPRPDQVTALIESIRSAADELEKGVPALDREKKPKFTVYDLLQRATEDEPGYPPTSGHDGSGRTTGSYPNPVMHLATVGEPGSPHNDFGEILTALEEAKFEVDSAVRALLEARPRPQIRKGPPGCRSCGRLPKNWVPLYERHENDGLCRKCWEWWKAHSEEELPPLGVIEAWRDGRRLTTKIIREAYAADKETARSRRQLSKKKGRRARRAVRAG